MFSNKIVHYLITILFIHEVFINVCLANISLGKYVRIDNPTEELTLYEVQVISNGVNVAQNGLATQSSTRWNYSAEKAIDGITTRTEPSDSMTLTDGIVDQWWEVSLEELAIIDKIVIFNRDEYSIEKRLENAVISILDEDRNMIWSSSPIQIGESIHTFITNNSLPNITYREPLVIKTINLGVRFRAKLQVTDVETDNSELVYSMENKPSWMGTWVSSNVPGMFNYAGTPGVGDAGLYKDIVISVEDEHGGKASLPPFDIEVIDPNNTLPQLKYLTPPVNISKTGVKFVIRMQANDLETNDSNLKYSLINKPSWISYWNDSNVPGKGHYKGTPDESDVGIYRDLTVMVEDGQGGKTSLPPFDLEVVNQSLVAINWDNPSPITYGSPIGKSQLCATSSIEGTFEYSHSVGDVLDAGINQISVTFVPDDLESYLASTMVIELEVLKKELIVVARDEEKYETDENPDFMADFSGFVENESVNDLLAIPVFKCDADTDSLEGQYSITLKDGEDNNYKFSYISGTLSVVKPIKPVLINDDIEVSENTLIELNVLENDQISEEVEFEISLLTATINSEVTLSSNGILTYKANPGFWGHELLTYQVSSDYYSVTCEVQVSVERTLNAQVSGGFKHSLILKENGSLWALGNNEFGQLGDGTTENKDGLVEIVSANVVAVSAGEDYSLFVKSDGSLWGMGKNSKGQLGKGDLLDQHIPVKIVKDGVSKISAGRLHSLFIKVDGSLWGMGWNHYGQLGDGLTQDSLLPKKIMDNNVVQAEVGYFHSLILKVDGSMWAVGNNSFGQLGDGTKDSRLEPIKVVLEGVKAIAAGFFHSLFVKSNGSVWGFGRNFHSQISKNDIENILEPIEIIKSGVVSVQANNASSYFLKENGSLWVMGSNGSGQLGLGDVVIQNEPYEAVEEGVLQISGGQRHLLTVKKDGSFWGVGLNSDSQLGRIYNESEDEFVIIDKGDLYARKDLFVAIENSHSNKINVLENDFSAGDLILSSITVSESVNGKVNLTLDGWFSFEPNKNYWGLENLSYVLTDGNSSVEGEIELLVKKNTPIAVDDELIIKGESEVYSINVLLNDNDFEKGILLADGLSETKNATVNLSKEGVLTYSPNNNISGEEILTYTVNNGVYSEEGKIYVKINPSLKPNEVIQVASGFQHCLVLKEDGSLWAMGRNDSGQLGDGSFVTREVPVEIFSEGVVQVSASKFGSYILKADGSLWEVGDSIISERENQNIPNQVVDEGVESFEIGYDHLYILKRDGSLYAIGNNDSGQLGDGTNVSKSNFIKVINGDVESYSLGDRFSLILKKDGTVWGTGRNLYGQLGGNDIDINILKEILLNNQVKITQIEAGRDYSLFLQGDGKMIGLGSGSSYRFGINTGSNIEPIFFEDLGSIETINASDSMVYYTKGDGELWGMGRLNGNQFGLDSPFLGGPIKLISKGIRQVYSGVISTYIVKNDGSLWATGSNSYGQLGDGTKNFRDVPVLIMGGGLYAGDDYLELSEGEEKVLDLLENDMHDGYSLTASSLSNSKNAIVSLSSSGVLTYKPNPGFWGNDELTYILSDGATSVIGKVSILVKKSSLMAKDDFIIIDGRDRSYSLNILENDSDFDQGILAITDISKSYNASISFTEDGILTYQPNVDFVGTEVLTYTVFNGIYSETGKIYVSSNGLGKQNKVVKVAAGGDHTLVMKSNGSLWAMGQNLYGQLGDGTFIQRINPVEIISHGVIDIAASFRGSYFLKEDGSLWWMGHSVLTEELLSKQKDPVEIVSSGVAAVKVGVDHICILKTDGSLWGAGFNEYGQIGDGTNVFKSDFVEIFSGSIEDFYLGSRFTIVLKTDGTVWGAGRNSNGQIGGYDEERNYFSQIFNDTNIEKPYSVDQISVGHSHSLFLMKDKKLLGLGDGRLGEFGIPSSGKNAIGLTLDETGDINEVFASIRNSFSCFIKKDGSLWGTGFFQEGGIFGLQEDGFFGAQDIFSHGEPIELMSENIEEVTIGYKSIFIIKTDGSLWATGDNANGQLGDGTINDRSVPVQIMGGSLFAGDDYIEMHEGGGEVTIDLLKNDIDEGHELIASSLSSTKNATVSLSSSGVLSYSPNPGFIGKETLTYALSNGVDNVYGKVNVLVKKVVVTKVSAAYSHYLILKSDGSLWGLGRSWYGQLGQGEAHRKYYKPIKIIDGEVSDISAGGSYSLFIKNDGSLWGMGDNRNGQLVSGEEDHIYYPERIVDSDVVQVSSGGMHSSFVKSDGSLWLLGTYGLGTVGDEEFRNIYRTEDLYSFKPIKIMDSVAEVACGQSHDIILTKYDKKVWTLGLNNHGQLGDGTKEMSLIPKELEDFRYNVLKIFAGENNSIIINRNNEYLTFGYEYREWPEYAHIDHNYKKYINNLYPVHNKYGEDVIDASAGHRYNMVIKSDGSLWAHGYNNYGQLGIGTYIYSRDLVQVLDSDVKQVSATVNYSLILKSNGTLLSTGDDLHVQIGTTYVGKHNSPLIVIPGSLLAKDDYLTVNEDSLGGIVNIFENDLNPEGSLLSAKLISSTENAQVELSASGVFSYKPNKNFFGSEEFVYEVSDGKETVEGKINVTIVGQPDPLIAKNDVLNVKVNSEIVTINVLANDLPINDKTLRTTLVSSTANASATLLYNGEFSYRPNYNFEGKEELVYEVSNGEWTSRAMINIEVSHFKPIANDDFLVLNKNESTVIINVLENDLSLTEGKLEANYIFPTDNSTVSLLEDGTLAYKPNKDFFGDETIIYKVWDGTHSSNGKVNVTVREDLRAFISNGSEFSQLLKTDGSLWGVGSNEFGQLGDGLTENTNSYRMILGSGVSRVISGHEHTIIIKNDGSLWGVGSNEFGQLGLGTTENKSFFSEVTSDDVIQGEATSHTLFVKRDDSLWGMGKNSDGQLGIGSTADVLFPVEIISSEIARVATGGYHSLVLKKDGSLWTMGLNDKGQLGDGTNLARNLPVKIMDNGVSNISAGLHHSLILKTDGSLWGMGSNGEGQLGDGTNIDRNVPVEIIDSKVMGISTGDNHSLVLKKDGSLWGMGSNLNGELGDESNLSKNTPFLIFKSDVTKVTAGEGYTHVIKDNGSLWAMGKNQYGQLGDFTEVNKNSPTLIEQLPVIRTANPPKRIIENTYYSYSFSAFNGLGAEVTYSYHSSGGDELDLEIDPIHGLLSGVPRHSGVYTITVIAKNEQGEKDSYIFDLDVVEADFSSSINSLVGEYNFSENFSDSSGENQNGIREGEISFVADRFGRENKACLFNDSSSKIHFPTSFVSSDEVTISFWFLSPEVIMSGGGAYGGFNAVSSNSNRFGITIGDFTSSIDGEVLGAYGRQSPDYPRSGVMGTSVGGAIGLGWHHLVFRSNNDGHDFVLDGKIYKPDVLNSWEHINNLMPVDNILNSYMSGSEGFVIDDLKLYDRSLSTNEVYQLYLETSLGQEINEPPLVELNEFLKTQSRNIHLEAIVDDSTLPIGEIQYLWKLKSVPLNGIAEIDNVNNRSVDIELSKSGSYVFEFIATDGQMSTVKDIIVLYENVPDIIELSFVNDGDEKGVVLNTFLKAKIISSGGEEIDQSTYEWSVKSGVGDVMFSHPNNFETELTFKPKPNDEQFWGKYEIQFSAKDGDIKVTKVIDVTVLNYAELEQTDLNTFDYQFSINQKYDLNQFDQPFINGRGLQVIVAPDNEIGHVSLIESQSINQYNISVDKRGYYLIRSYIYIDGVYYYDDVEISVVNTAPRLNFIGNLRLPFIEGEIDSVKIIDDEDPIGVKIIWEVDRQVDSQKYPLEVKGRDTVTPYISTGGDLNQQLYAKVWLYDHELISYYEFEIITDVPPVINNIDVVWMGDNRYRAVLDYDDDYKIETSFVWSSPHVDFVSESENVAEFLMESKYSIIVNVTATDLTSTVNYSQEVSTRRKMTVGGGEVYKNVKDALTEVSFPLESPLTIVVKKTDVWEIENMVIEILGKDAGEKFPLVIEIEQDNLNIGKVEIVNSENIIFKNLYIHNENLISEEYGVLMNGSNNIEFIDSTFINFKIDYALKAIGTPNMKINTKNIMFKDTTHRLYMSGE